MRIIYIIFFTLLLFSFSSCDESYSGGKDHTITTTHEYGTETSVEEHNQIELDRIARAKENPDRNDWQKPRDVVRILGNLKEKVVADIGVGTGYFTFNFLPYAGKVIAIDIDKNALIAIDAIRDSLQTELQTKLETRWVEEDNPKLKDNEVDIVFISNTFTYFENKVDYLKTVYKGLKPKGRVCIVDFKMKKLPQIFPPFEERTPLYEVENLLEEAGFHHLFSDDQTLDYQYVVIAEKQ